MQTAEKLKTQLTDDARDGTGAAALGKGFPMPAAVSTRSVNLHSAPAHARLHPSVCMYTQHTHKIHMHNTHTEHTYTTYT